MKVVISRCFGGFGLSNKAMMRYAELKGIKLYFVTNDRSVPLDIHNWKLKYADPDDDSLFIYHITQPLDANGYAPEGDGVFFGDSDFDRDDPLLVQVVEELGDTANTRFSKLEVVEIPDGIEWTIHDYDGSETVEEAHRSW